MAPSSLAAPLTGQSAFLLPNNNSVLFVGGTSNGTPLNTSELYMPWAGAFGAPATISSARNLATGSPLAADGMLLVAGGNDGTNTLATSEVYGFATVKTDQADYAPGTPVIITGSGWQPGETVTLSLLESPYYDSHPNLTAVADANGNIVNSQFSPDLHDLNIRFYLTATGSASQAQTTFTDAKPNTVTVGTQAPNPVHAGNSATYTVTVGFNGDSIACTVNLSVSGLPAGASSGGFSPSSVTGTGVGSLTSTLTINTTASLAANTYSFTVTATPASGSCQTGASAQSGNGSLVVSAPVNVATTLALNSVSPNSVPFGSAGPVTFTATLTRNDTSAGVVGATVNFTVDGNPAGSAVTGTGGVATFSTYNPSALSVAGHNVQASFTAATVGGTSFLGSTSGSAALTVNKADTTTTVGAITPEPTVTGQSYTVSWNVAVDAPGAGTPTGTVTVDDGTGGTCSAAVAAGSCSFASTSAGAKTITATYGGDSNFNSSHGAKSHTVNKADTSATVVSSLNPSVYGQTVTFTAAVAVNSPGSGTPTGLVTFYDGVTSIGTGILSGNQATLMTASLTASGSPHSITVAYGGDLNFNPSPASAAISQVVNKASTSITNVAAAPEPSTLGASYTVSWTLSVLPPGGGSPTGTVSVGDGNGNTCTATLPANSCQLISTSVGTKTLTATYGGDGNFIGSSGTGSHTVDFGFAGLFDPYAPPSAGRAYKINSAIPLKWDYLDTNGNVVPSSNAQPQVIIYGPFACGSTPNMDVITVNTAGASGYQYDPGSNSWQFNWKTTGLASGCYNINIKSNLTGQPNGAFPIQLR